MVLRTIAIVLFLHLCLLLMVAESSCSVDFDGEINCEDSTVILQSRSQVSVANHATEISQALPVVDSNPKKGSLLPFEKNSVGNLRIFIIGLGTDACVIALCIFLFVYWSGKYPILFGKGNMLPTQGGLEPAQVPESVIAKANAEKQHIIKDAEGFWQPANQSWLGFAYASWSLDYEQIDEAAGLDKAMLIMFIDKCIRAFKWIAIPMFCIIGPVNCFFGGNAAGLDHESWFSLGNVQLSSWLHWMTGFTCCYVAYIVCNMICIDGMFEFQGYRQKWLLQLDDKRSRSLMMAGIPEQYQNEAACTKFWNMLMLDKVEKVYITKDVDVRMPSDDSDFDKLKDSPNASYTLAEMVSRRDSTKVLLDAAFNDNRPELQMQYKGELAQLSKDIAIMRAWTSKTAEREIGSNPPDVYPVNLSTGFITFKDRLAAACALKMDLGLHHKEWVMDKAPEPVDILWSDFTEDPTAGGARVLLGYALTVSVICIYMPLVVLISNVAEAINLGPFQTIWSSQAPNIGLIVMIDFLPTLLVLIFTNCFSVYDKSRQQLKVTVWYFWMNTLFVVLVTAFGTNFIGFVETLANDPLKIFHLLATTMPNCTHSYMNYLGVQCYAMTMQLTRYMEVIKYRIFIRHHDEEEARALAEPEDQDYYGIGSRTARFSTLVTIGIVYGTLSPPCSVLAWMTVFWIRTLFGYIFVFNETKKPDSGGAFMQRALHNMYVALHIYFILMIGVLDVRGNGSGPAIIAFCGWIYVFTSQYKFEHLKWEHIDIVAIQEGQDKVIKKRTLHGKYEQPEMYD